jgi:sec-independent protein translocase protein TatB
MFDIGMSHLVVIAIAGILILGPEKLPGFARQAARTWRAVRAFTADINERITGELMPDGADTALRDLDPRSLWDRALLGEGRDGDAPQRGWGAGSR